MNINLSGKAALVTGSSQGLGEAIARKLHECGASVVINYFQDEAGINRARAEAVVRSLGERAMACEADVRSMTSVDAMVSRVIETFGHLDMVVNNAGIIADRSLKKMTEDEWCRVIETNLTGVYHICKSIVERLADGGRIVNLSSISAIVGFFGQVNYAASKAGVIGLTKSLSREMAKRGITVNAVAPGVVLTDMGRSIPHEARTKMLESIPLGRFGEPGEIANVVLFLCSDLASYVTGQVIHVNGGWLG